MTDEKIDAVVETTERKALILEAMRDAEMCVLQHIGKDNNPFATSAGFSADEGLALVCDKAWVHHVEFQRMSSAIKSLEETVRRHELRDSGVKR